jgi:hypothetical protein
VEGIQETEEILLNRLALKNSGVNPSGPGAVSVFMENKIVLSSSMEKGAIRTDASVALRAVQLRMECSSGMVSLPAQLRVECMQDGSVGHMISYHCSISSLESSNLIATRLNSSIHVVELSVLIPEPACTKFSSLSPVDGQLCAFFLGSSPDQFPEVEFSQE